MRMNQIAETAEQSNEKTKKPWFKKWWVWVIAAVVIIGGIGAIGGDDEKAPVAAEQEAVEKPAEKVLEEEPAPEPKPEPAPEPEKPAEPEVPAEFKSSLNKAQSYSDMMHMSKAGLYEQLTSEFGEKFSPEAAQYGVDNVKADWNANALAKAKSYQEMMSMSPESIRDQLTSEFGEKFTQEEADYAIANL